MWNWKERTILQDIDLGNDGMVPLELRFLHNPDATEGYVGAALSSNMIHFYKDKVCSYIIMVHLAIVWFDSDLILGCHICPYKS